MLHLSSLKNFSFEKLLTTAGLWWRRWSSLIFSVLFLAVIGLGVFTWYESLYLFHWSQGDEQAYRLSKNQQVKFQQEKFDAVLGALDDRAGKHRGAPGTFRDLFFGD